MCSNYTTSAAVWQPGEDRLTTAGRLLPVREGAIGLQQSEAVFLHTRQLPEMVERAVTRVGRQDRLRGGFLPAEGRGRVVHALLPGGSVGGAGGGRGSGLPVV